MRETQQMGVFQQPLAGQMIDQRTDLLVIEGLVDEAINSEVYGFFKEGVSSPGNHQEDARLRHSFDVMEKIFLPDAGSVDVQDKDVEFFGG